MIDAQTKMLRRLQIALTTIKAEVESALITLEQLESQINPGAPATRARKPSPKEARKEKYKARLRAMK